MPGCYVLAIDVPHRPLLVKPVPLTKLTRSGSSGKHSSECDANTDFHDAGNESLRLTATEAEVNSDARREKSSIAHPLKPV